MPATRSQIEDWLKKLYEDDSPSHMIIKCDTFEYRGGPGDSCCYPIYVSKDEDVHERVDKNSDRTMEVYSANHTLKEQMAAHRAFNYD